MERADFVHLVRLSEQACEQDTASYRRSVAAFAALGYAWVVGCFLLAAGVLWWLVASAMQGRVRGVFIWAAIAAAGLLWASARALWCRLEPPQGMRLQPQQAPALFEALERIRKKVKGPRIDAVYLDGEFNAGITQRPRWGLFGGARNELVIGLPLLMALDRQRLLAVLAHEYGHLRGDHGRFAAWIYRTRLSWHRLYESLQDDDGVVGAATQGFLRWYFPRFVAKTFALARQDEYEADRIAGKLLGKDVAGAALVEVVVKGDWLGEKFWPAHWNAAARSPLPQGPFASMHKLLALEPPEAFARQSLRQALRRVSDVDDTHPVLRDRLEALGASPGLPAWSRKSALDLLGQAAAPAMAHFDRQWCRDSATAWKEQHAYLGRVQARVQLLLSRLAGNTADEMVELADLQRRLDPQADGTAHYERALQLSAHHGGALRGLVQSLLATSDPRCMPLLAELHEHSAAHRWWAAHTAVEQLEADPGFDEKALKLWRERRRQAEEAEERAWEELRGSGLLEATSRHDLGEFEAGELQGELARCAPLARAWLLRKNLREFPWRRCYVLLVELPALEEREQWETCRGLERWLSLPGPVVVACTGDGLRPADVQRQAGAAFYQRA